MNPRGRPLILHTPQRTTTIPLTKVVSRESPSEVTLSLRLVDMTRVVIATIRVGFRVLLPKLVATPLGSGPTVIVADEDQH